MKTQQRLAVLFILALLAMPGRAAVPPTYAVVDAAADANTVILVAVDDETSPRMAAGPDFSPSTKQASNLNPDYSESFTYTIRLLNQGDPISAPLQVMDVVPTGLAYVPGTLTATGGVYTDTAAPILRWSGVLSPTPAVTITFAVSVTYNPTQPDTSLLLHVITNTAFIVVPGYETLTRAVSIRVGKLAVYLPLVMSASPVVEQALIVDHTSVDINAVPQAWIDEAKRTLHIAYGHTSHGSQVTGGMSGLIGFANGGGRGLALPKDIFAWNNGGTDGALDLHDYAMEDDVGYYPQWVDETRSYLGTPDLDTGRGTNQPDVNVIIWSWCGQASGYSEQDMLDKYLLPMTQLEADYPGVTFVYMTGHSDGTGETGNLHLRNQQIRQYVIQNDKVLYDFYNIELYDPDGAYYGDKYVLDSCQYDGNGNGNPWDDSTNWALDWQATHTQNVDWYSCSCAHSQALNCNQKAYAAWWLWARLAGWDGTTLR